MCVILENCPITILLCTVQNSTLKVIMVYDDSECHRTVQYIIMSCSVVHKKTLWYYRIGHNVTFSFYNTPIRDFIHVLSTCCVVFSTCLFFTLRLRFVTAGWLDHYYSIEQLIVVVENTYDLKRGQKGSWRRYLRHNPESTRHRYSPGSRRRAVEDRTRK